jgi:hypothetical protein
MLISTVCNSNVASKFSRQNDKGNSTLVEIIIVALTWQCSNFLQLSISTHSEKENKEMNCEYNFSGGQILNCLACS